MALLSFLDRSKTIADAGFSRWLVPPAALAIHLAIGQVYAFSVFKIPLSQLMGLSKPGAGDWKQSQIAWIFSLAFMTLGLSAAAFGKWLEGAGPRKAMFASATCFAAGFFISYFGVIWHQLWIIFLGYGVVGGIGLGLGYISPVSTLIRWFPDRPGLATGMAIMGFGGGAMIGSPLAIKLMAHFRTATDLGVGRTFLAMGTLYFVFMMFGVFTIRVAPEGWKPTNWTAPVKPQAMITNESVAVHAAFKTQQFWLLWVVLCLNVTAGIGIIEQASPMIQDLFKGAIGPVAAGGFVGLLSLFNMGGRFFWSSISDHIGRKLHLLHIFRIGGGSLLHAPSNRWQPLEQRDALCGVRLRAAEYVWGRVRHHSRLLARHVWNLSCERHSRTAVDGMVYGGNFGTGAGELHAGIPVKAWRRKSGCVSERYAHHGWVAGRGICSELADAAGGGEILAAGCFIRARATIRPLSGKELKNDREQEILSTHDNGGMDCGWPAGGVGRVQHGDELTEAVSEAARGALFCDPAEVDQRMVFRCGLLTGL